VQAYGLPDGSIQIKGLYGECGGDPTRPLLPGCCEVSSTRLVSASGSRLAQAHLPNAWTGASLGARDSSAPLFSPEAEQIDGSMRLRTRAAARLCHSPQGGN